MIFISLSRLHLWKEIYRFITIQRSLRETENSKRKFNPMHFFPSLEATFSIASNSYLWLDNIHRSYLSSFLYEKRTDILVINKVLNCFYNPLLQLSRRLILLSRAEIYVILMYYCRESHFSHNVLINAIAYNSQLIFFAVRLNYSLFQLHN